jgi:hypothetical protein
MREVIKTMNQNPAHVDAAVFLVSVSYDVSIMYSF